MFQRLEVGGKHFVWKEVSERDMREAMSRHENPRAGMTTDFFVADLLQGGTRQVGYYYYRFWPKDKAGNPSL